jgi:putative DNA primase/helicase
MEPGQSDDKLKSRLPKAKTNGADHGENWKTLLQYNLRGLPLANIYNAETIFDHDPEVAGALAFNEFAGTVIKRGPLPWDPELSEWTDADTNFACSWAQRKHVINITPAILPAAVGNVARKHKFHPVRDYFNELHWEGAFLVGDWLSTYLGVESTPYSRAVGQCYLISVVARVFKPGCQVDTMIILEGPQGIGKSRVFRILAIQPEWFTDRLSELGSKDAALELRGKMIIEMSELNAILSDRSENRAIKGFLSRESDCYRAPYDRTTGEHDRQCVFAGTTNQDTYLRDESGARRFWPIRCGDIDLEGLKRDLPQLYAEAVHLYQQQVPWHLSLEMDALADIERDKRYQHGPWHEVVRRFVENPEQRSTPDRDNRPHPVEPWDNSTAESVTVSDILIHGIGKVTDRWGHSDEIWIAKALKAMGWVKHRPGTAGNQQWRYRRGHL